jgi:hypothetical protein
MVSLSKHARAFFQQAAVFGAASSGTYGHRGSLLRPVIGEAVAAAAAIIQPSSSYPNPEIRLK